MIREMLLSDAPRILEIYEMGISTRNATFETAVPLWEEWDGNHHGHSRFVYCEDGKVVGWVAVSPVSTRRAYAGAAEISLYVDVNCSGRGIGTALMNKVIQSSEAYGIWTLYSSIFPENLASIAIHRACGFRLVGVREKIACLDGKWRDTVIMERRSKIVGV